MEEELGERYTKMGGIGFEFVTGIQFFMRFCYDIDLLDFHLFFSLGVLLIS